MDIRHRVINPLLLVLTALIWGIAFVAQSTGGDAIGPLSFSCTRSWIAAFVLFIFVKVSDKLGRSGRKPVTREEKKNLILGGCFTGLFLCLTSVFQQLGLYLGTPTGKAGFLTACYIILVPILGLLLGRKCGVNVWIAVVITVFGLYLLCMHGSLSIQLSDVLVLICSLMCALHILTVDHFIEKADPVRMSCIQFFVAALLTTTPMFWLEMGHSTAGIAQWSRAFTMPGTWVAVLYAGVLSSGVAYTLQNVGQEGVNPALASLLMSLESVFSVIAGWLILGDSLNARELTGCCMIFAAVVLAQLPVDLMKKPVSSKTK